ncbi:hypothetical protein [Actinocorallia populi]|uniref:hypothetical protein n=1 Tax=Actinocorallia populi TaxID=2079200 RepID=UPI0013009B1E|nr:hypothetical protein [Actinocorallia populi]
MTVEAIVRVGLAPGTAPASFERWSRSRAMTRAVWALAGDDDYELRLSCPGLAELSAELTALRGAGGAARTSTSLLLREVIARPSVEETSPDADPEDEPFHLAHHHTRHARG